MPIPARGDSAQPPLALNLYYMITAYAREQGDSGDIASHNLLGRAMRVLSITRCSAAPILLFG